MEKERWKLLKVDGIKPIYKISNYGRVKNRYSNIILKQFVDKGGYYKVSLSTDEGNTRYMFVHRLVGLHFIPNDDPIHKTTINHINFDKSDQYYKNLEWMSMGDNVRYSFSHGRHTPKIGEEVPNNRYSTEQIETVCRLLSKGLSNKDIFEMTGVPSNITTFIKKGKLWKHVAKKYKITPPPKHKKFEHLYQDIDDLIGQGYQFNDIVLELNLPRNKAMRSLVRRRINKLCSSTTIESGKFMIIFS